MLLIQRLFLINNDDANFNPSTKMNQILYISASKICISWKFTFIMADNLACEMQLKYSNNCIKLIRDSICCITQNTVSFWTVFHWKSNGIQRMRNKSRSKTIHTKSLMVKKKKNNIKIITWNGNISFNDIVVGQWNWLK